MDDRQQQQTKRKKIVEALILAAPEPITAQKLAQIVPHLKPAAAKALVAELKKEYDEQDRAFEVWEVAGGYQIRTRPEYAGYLRQLQVERPLRLSRAALETLAVVAYKQPVTRAEIEHVRGVDVGATVRSLVDRQLIRIAGHREVPGRPMLYATTRRFLEVFGLTRLEDLPTLRDIEEFLPPPEEAPAAPGEVPGELH
ncbi:MAG: SMC-Scp complex subunit ScpB [Deltaproteobacteria bacterium]|jgi:segregation and condensation protein B|nr:SMC-Scp complex subunit ScpB [Deltaproteobacteria bacterium]